MGYQRSPGKLFEIRNLPSFVCSLSVSISLSGCFLFSNDHDVEHPQPAIVETAESSRTDPYIVVDSAADELIVYKGGVAAMRFKNIAVGAAGVKEKLRSGDDVTPSGVYTVGWIKRESKFTVFIGLSYPSIADATRGYERGVITYATLKQIKDAIQRGRVPPQDTALGGFIGIHGVGRGDIRIHRIANWTAGCIAVENPQIEALSRLVYPGVQVEIR